MNDSVEFAGEEAQPGALPSLSRTRSRRISAAAAAYDPGCIEPSDPPNQSLAASAAPPSSQPAPAPAPVPTRLSDFWDAQIDTDDFYRSLRTVTPHHDSLVRLSLSAGTRHGAPHTDLAGAVLRSVSPGLRVARPHRAAAGSSSSSLSPLSAASSSSLAGDLMRPCSTAGYPIARAVAAMADDRMDDYHNFLRWLAAVESRNHAAQHRGGAVVASHYAYDGYGRSMRVPLHSENARFSGHDAQELPADEGDEPDNVLGVRAPQVHWEDMPGKREMKPLHDLQRMARRLRWSEARIESFGDSLMESDLADTDERWNMAVTKVDCVGN